MTQLKERLIKIKEQWRKLIQVEPVPPSKKWITILVVSKDEKLAKEIYSVWPVSSCSGSAEIVAKNDITSSIVIIL